MRNLSMLFNSFDYFVFLLVFSMFVFVYPIGGGRIVNGSVLKSLDTSFCKRLRFDEKLIYLHFQKTAGTSVESGLARFVKELNSVCKLHRIFARPSGSHYRKSHFTEAEQRADILAGHGYWGCHSKINISSTYVYAGFFRDPVKRALSHHLRSSCKQEKGCNMKKFGLLHAQNYFYNRLVYSGGLVDAGRYGETLQSKVPREIIERNKDGNLLNLAFQRIDEMKFVGIVEEFDQSMFLFGRFLSRHFGIPEDTQVSLVYCRSKNSYKNLYEGKLRPGSLDKMFKVDKHIFDIAKKKFDGYLSTYERKNIEDFKKFGEKQKRFERECCTPGKKKTCEANFYTFFDT